ncbi:exodeoxyribonuclease VIII [Enterobacter hormaechei]|uniref:exodeoxyribonuclease VIII n=1 Tax=Enterobacter hormaechei TaxID=158836 RepID=UPI00207548D9|nr:exodeoxyribonuclease VIII [Enterobacter hormaechei]MCM7436950.1 exodeoxyribonuclease VIII [Enterobacter hormaechei]HDT1607728.1 exodeoxyribonuclease VIII [Enterobacter hormaechei subsp. steigerwaltii]
MSVELKVFGGAYFPKDKALKKFPDLKPLAISVNALNKGIAEAVIFGKLAAAYPEHIEDYFKVKIWEHREDLPRPALDDFSLDFFGTSVVWNVNAGEPAATQPEEDENQNQSDDRQAEEMKSVRQLDQHSRAACLALFGPVEQITAAQYGQVVDLKNDDESSFARELAEALAKETRALALAPERQTALLAWLRETAKDSSQWPDIKKLIAKWIDTPADKRPQPASTSGEENRTDSGATLGGGNRTDRSPDLVHNLSTLRIEVATAILSMFETIDIYAIPNRFFIPAKAMAEADQDPCFTAWWKQFRATPGILDYSRAAIFALIKSAPEDLWLNPVKLREYINRELIESDHAHPDQKTIDTACNPKPRPEKNENDETQPPVSCETELPAVCPGRAAQLDKELNDAFKKRASVEQEQQTNDQPHIENLGGGVFSVDSLTGENSSTPPALTDREIQIAHTLNDLISGRTPIMGDEEAAGVVACTGHLPSHVIPLLLADITTTEFCLSPDLTDEEIHDVATTLLDSWSDDISVRQKIAFDAIVEYRRPEAPKAIVLDPPVITARPKKDVVADPEHQPHMLNYRQQLILAAMQGMCANPSYRADFDDLPAMAIELADSVINQDGI